MRRGAGRSRAWARSAGRNCISWRRAASGRQHGSLADGAGVGVGQGDAQVEGVGIDGEKGIGPRAGLMHIHIHAFGGQRDQGQGGALAVAFGGGGLGGGLRLLLGADGVLGDADDGLLFLVAGGDERQRPRKSRARAANPLYFECGITLQG